MVSHASNDEEESLPMVGGSRQRMAGTAPEAPPRLSERSAAPTASGGGLNSLRNAAWLCAVLLALNLVMGRGVFDQLLSAGAGGSGAVGLSVVDSVCPSPPPVPPMECPPLECLECPQLVCPSQAPSSPHPSLPPALPLASSPLPPALFQEQPLQPDMTQPEQALLVRSLQAASHVWEWGCGGSTALAASMSNIHSIRSVESMAEWRTRVLDATSMYGKRVHIALVSLGPSVAWGRPSDDSMKHNWPNYTQAFRKRASAGTEPGADGSALPPLPEPDLVLIDGRFRVACALEVVLSGMRPLVAFHDFADRIAYHVVLSFYDVVEEVERLAVMRPRSEWDASAVRAMYDTHLWDVYR